VIAVASFRQYFRKIRKSHAFCSHDTEIKLVNVVHELQHILCESRQQAVGLLAQHDAHSEHA